MSINSNTKTSTVNRAVALAFIPNPKSYPMVRHLDDDIDNNNVDNLAWGTAADNSADMRCPHCGEFLHAQENK